MQRLVLASLLAAACLVSAAEAQAQSAQHRFGLGIQAGEPNAFTGKYWLDRRTAIQGLLGWRTEYYRWSRHGYSRYDGPIIAVDWTTQFIQWEPWRGKVRMGVHAGIGGALGTEACYHDDFGVRHCAPVIAARVPIGFDVSFLQPRIEVYVEAVPGLSLVPGFGPLAMAGLGARFYF